MQTLDSLWFSTEMIWLLSPGSNYHYVNKINSELDIETNKRKYFITKLDSCEYNIMVDTDSAVSLVTKRMTQEIQNLDDNAW